MKRLKGIAVYILPCAVVCAVMIVYTLVYRAVS